MARGDPEHLPAQPAGGRASGLARLRLSWPGLARLVLGRQVRREKEAAIDVQDFETAAMLRDKEARLLDENGWP
jgi:UvrB/uvrC motif